MLFATLSSVLLSATSPAALNTEFLGSEINNGENGPWMRYDVAVANPSDAPVEVTYCPKESRLLEQDPDRVQIIDGFAVSLDGAPRSFDCVNSVIEGGKTAKVGVYFRRFINGFNRGYGRSVILRTSAGDIFIRNGEATLMEERVTHVSNGAAAQ